MNPRGLAVAVFALAACNKLTIEGTIQKVRVYAVDETTSAVVADYRITNTARLPLVVREVMVEIEDKDGKTTAGRTIADTDASRFLDANPEQGPKHNASLLPREKLSAGQSVDRMVAASFDSKEDEVNARRKLRVKIVDVDGPIVVLDGSK